MAAPYRRSAFVFRSDLRLQDNLSLHRALALSSEVHLCFVAEPRWLDRATRNDKALQFLQESLADLEGAIRERGGRLHRFRDTLPSLVERLLVEAGMEAIFLNRDHAPLGRQVEARLEDLCARHGAYLGRAQDRVLHPPGSVLAEDGTPHDTFRAFEAAARRRPVPETLALPEGRLADASLPLAEDIRPFVERVDPELYVRGGRHNALAILAALEEYADYARDADFPDRHATTSLSAHLRFGTVSPREVWHAFRDHLGEAHPLCSRLLLRDFLIHQAAFQPRLLEASAPTLDLRTEARFQAWSRGRTAVPLVDAAIRQLLATGFANHRMREVAASYLVHDLGVPAVLGERFFARHQVDADPALNAGNWRMVAEGAWVGEPRRLDPWEEQARLDPEGHYVREWVPELEGLDAGALLALRARRTPPPAEGPSP